MNDPSRGSGAVDCEVEGSPATERDADAGISRGMDFSVGVDVGVVCTGDGGGGEKEGANSSERREVMMPFPKLAVNDLFTLLYQPEELAWQEVHPSGLNCPRAIYYRLNKPELGNPLSWRELAGITFVGTALHAHFLPLLARFYERQGYVVQQEVEVIGEIAGMPMKGRLDLLVTNPVTEEKLVVDCKFLHPNAIHKVFPHHLRQVAAYCLLANAPYATLYYIARDMQDMRVHDIDADTLERTKSEVVELLKQANVEDEDQLPPPFPPNNYPCTYATARGQARCPFFGVCHTEIPERNPVSEDLTQLVEDYLELLSEIEEHEELLKPLKAQKEEYERMLKSYMKHGQIVTTPYGSVRLIEMTQERMDTNAVRKLLSSLGLQVPTTTVVARRLEVNLKGGAD
jgi:hypothetical protein